MPSKAKLKQDAAPKGLKNALAAIRKQYGAKSLVMGDEMPRLERVPTGIFILDVAMGIADGVPGIAKGRTTMLVGDESSAKSYTLLRILSAFQRLGEPTALVESEHTFDPRWSSIVGVNVAELLVQPSESAQESLDVASQVIRNVESGVVGIDSMAALAPAEEVEASTFEWQQGLAARLFNKGFRLFQSGQNASSKLGAEGMTAGCTLIVVQQYRTNIGGRRGPTRTIPGGAGQKFAASVQVSMWSGATVYWCPDNGVTDKLSTKSYKGDLGVPLGVTFHFQVTKNKTAAPYRSGQFVVFTTDFTAPDGTWSVKPGTTNDAEQLIRLAVITGVVERRGSWYKYGEANLGQGEQRSAARLEEDAELAGEIRGRVLALLEKQQGEEGG